MENHGQKRSADEQLDLLEGVKTILLDIEGTTTPASFVKDTLLPYVKENVKQYLEGHWEDEECQEDVEALRQQAVKDQSAEVEGAVAIPAKEENQESVVEAIVASVLWQLEADKTSCALKQLQGHVYREAFKTGKIQSEVFDDVVKALSCWAGQDRKVAVFSSESADTQRLLFGYSSKGDLQEKVASYFDTSVGAKTEKDSFAAIAKQLEASVEETLYLTGTAAEAKAAAEAGFKTCIVLRSGSDALSDDDKQKFNTVSSFEELCAAIEVPAAKKQEAEKSEEQEKEEEDKPEEEDKGEDKEEDKEEGDEEEEADVEASDDS